MTTLDLNDAGPQRPNDLIPAGTIVTVQLMIRNGGFGEGGWLTRSKDGGCEMLDLEFTVVDGEFAKRRIWQMLVLSGTSDGHSKAAEISRSFLRAVVESARNVKPDDTSEAAQNKRKVEFDDLNNLRFVARVSIEKSKDPAFPDKNKLQAVTPDLKSWKPVEQLPVQTEMPLARAGTPATAKPAQAITRPEWAS